MYICFQQSWFKRLAKPLSFPLSDLFNFLLASDKVPLVSLKKDDPSVVSNYMYRPISLLSGVGKVRKSTKIRNR